MRTATMAGLTFTHERYIHDGEDRLCWKTCSRNHCLPQGTLEYNGRLPARDAGCGIYARRQSTLETQGIVERAKRHEAYGVRYCAARYTIGRECLNRIVNDEIMHNPIHLFAADLDHIQRWLTSSEFRLSSYMIEFMSSLKKLKAIASCS
jgi:hypothetical protein